MLTLPGAHGSGAAAPPAQALPAGHVLQKGDTDPGAQYKPRGVSPAQLRQSVSADAAPGVERYVPRGQGVQEPLPKFEKKPAAHSIGTALPPAHANPAGHAVPVTVVDDPAAQKEPLAMSSLHGKQTAEEMPPGAGA